jgi:ribosomal protein S18 acetylase RimI-like enzyme
MRLIHPVEDHIIEMMSWFSTKQELIDWSGPNFRYPFDLASFGADLKLNTLNSFVLVSNESDFLAFGQYYQRLNKCHLGRIIVNPEFRGKGIISEFLSQICKIGLNQFGLKECSLFVLGHNNGAIKAYEKFGFSFINYPDKLPLENCLYMVK